MDFGLFYYCQGRGAPHDQIYAETLAQIELAERLGFRECWFAEHHFTDYSLLPSPNLLIAAALQRTETMRFGNYINVLPFHNPLRLAAEAAMLDNLARGRFDFGIGSGARPREFGGFGIDLNAAAAMTEESVEILLKAWTQERFTHTGRYWTIPEVSLRPRTYQRPHPPLHLVASHPPTVARAGERGWPVALHFTPNATVADCVAGYQQALERRTEPAGVGPYRPRVLVCRETFVAPTPEEARETGALALQGFWHLSTLREPPVPAEFSDERLSELTARIWGAHTYDELDQEGTMLIGSPEAVATRVTTLERLGVDTVLLVCSFGDLSHNQVCRSLELFSAAVIQPRGRTTAAPPG